ncbi:MAG TPA: VOC family protein [Anaerolinea sp.]|nr:VOC family protein [Anaerolinea sp.]
MQKITPFLWFDGQAEEAARYYTSIFKDSEITGITHYGEGNFKPAGTVMTVNFTVLGMEFTALNGGPEFKFTPAISFFIPCESQAEVDEYWEILSESGDEGQCGWIMDKFGVTWQIVPTRLLELLQDEDPEKAMRVTQVMMPMHKIELNKLEAAYAAA